MNKIFFRTIMLAAKSVAHINSLKYFAASNARGYDVLLTYVLGIVLTFC